MRIILIFLIVLTTAVCYADQRERLDSWKNFYGIAWNDNADKTPENHIRYAKQMGYSSIAISSGVYKVNYLNSPNITGLKFYFIDPTTYTLIYQGNTRTIDHTGTHTQSQINFYEQNMVWKGTDTFPNNLASGYFLGTSTRHYVEWDWQQQRVIDEVVESIISLAKSYEVMSRLFTYAGYMFDVPRLRGEFMYWDGGGEGVSTDLNYWTGADSGILHGTITHEYATYREGKAAFLKKLAQRTRMEFPHAKWLADPAYLYSNIHKDEWIYQIKNRADKDELTPDMLMQEGARTDFVDDTNNFNSGVDITVDRVACSQSSDVSEYTNRLIAAKAGVNGAWYHWYGRFGGVGSMPSFGSVTAVYARIKLAKCIPNWCNLSGVGTSNTSWNGNTFVAMHTAIAGNAPFAYMGTYTMYATHWKRQNEKFVVKMGTNTELYEPVVIGDGYYVKSIWSTNGYFEPVADVKATQWTKTGNSWQINSGVVAGINTDGGIGFIFKVYPKGGYTIN